MNTAANGADFLFTVAGFSLIFELFPRRTSAAVATDAAAPFLEYRCSFSWHTIDASVAIMRSHCALKSCISLHKVCHMCHTNLKGKEDHRKLNLFLYVR